MKSSSTPSGITSAASGLLPMRAVVAGKAVIGMLEVLTPVLDLGIRIMIGLVFFQSGLTKIASWATTLALFHSEYSVPLLPPALAAYMGTAAELGFPVLLVLGLGTRGAAFGLFIFNIIAVLSYPGLSDAGLRDHQYWGVLLLVILLHGPGKLSLDYLLSRHIRRALNRDSM
ncbi:DoxX family protein [Paraburkholderia sp. 40]|uniref:DoxX family protein n=1 Tax=Paraburkholderia sp. 40 TaxID=2991059 RepID=UPI003D1A7F64